MSSDSFSEGVPAKRSSSRTRTPSEKFISFVQQNDLDLFSKRLSQHNNAATMSSLDKLPKNSVTDFNKKNPSSPPPASTTSWSPTKMNMKTPLSSSTGPSLKSFPVHKVRKIETEEVKPGGSLNGRIQGRLAHDPHQGNEDARDQFDAGSADLLLRGTQSCFDDANFKKDTDDDDEDLDIIYVSSSGPTKKYHDKPRVILPPLRPVSSFDQHIVDIKLSVEDFQNSSSSDENESQNDNLHHINIDDPSANQKRREQHCAAAQIKNSGQRLQQEGSRRLSPSLKSSHLLLGADEGRREDDAGKASPTIIMEDLPECHCCFKSIKGRGCRIYDLNGHLLEKLNNFNSNSFQSAMTAIDRPRHECLFYCQSCNFQDLGFELSAFRKSMTNTQGARSLLNAVMQFKTPEPDIHGHLSDPYGCIGFNYQRALLNPNEVERLTTQVLHSTSDKYKFTSALTPSVMHGSKKIICCSLRGQQLRGGRYETCPLRPRSTLPLVDITLDSGESMNAFVTNHFPTRDPFVVSQELLCQQIAYHLEDLQPHCDRDRPDKTWEKQPLGFDGVGDRITSLTLRKKCWLVFRETKNLQHCFAIRLSPGDVYTMSGESRWKWQHAILLDEFPSCEEDARISLVWRILEEYPL